MSDYCLNARGRNCTTFHSPASDRFLQVYSARLWWAVCSAPREVSVLASPASLSSGHCPCHPCSSLGLNFLNQILSCAFTVCKDQKGWDADDMRIFVALQAKKRELPVWTHVRFPSSPTGARWWSSTQYCFTCCTEVGLFVFLLPLVHESHCASLHWLAMIAQLSPLKDATYHTAKMLFCQSLHIYIDQPLEKLDISCNTSTESTQPFFLVFFLFFFWDSRMREIIAKEQKHKRLIRKPVKIKIKLLYIHVTSI